MKKDVLMDAQAISKLVGALALETVSRYNMAKKMNPSLVAIVENPGHLPAFLYVDPEKAFGIYEKPNEAMFDFIGYLLKDSTALESMAPQSQPDSEIVGVFLAARQDPDPTTQDGISMLFYTKDSVPMFGLAVIDPVTNLAGVDFMFSPNSAGLFLHNSPIQGGRLH